MSQPPPHRRRTPFSRRALGLVARVALPCVLFVSAPVGAEEFLRGDVNGDGVVSLSDCHYLANYIFRGGPPPTCLDAADVLDRGDIDNSESAPGLRSLWKHLRHRLDIPAPFPHPGSDPTEDTLTCESYGHGSTIEDPVAKLEVLDVVATGGHDEYQVAELTVRLSSSLELAGYSGQFSIAGDVVRDVLWLDQGWLRDLFGKCVGFTEPGAGGPNPPKARPPADPPAQKQEPPDKPEVEEVPGRPFRRPLWSDKSEKDFFNPRPKAVKKAARKKTPGKKPAKKPSAKKPAKKSASKKKAAKKK